MLVNKGFKFLILPNKEQIILIEKTFGCTRLVYNHYLGLQKELLANGKKMMSYNHMANDMKKWKDDEKTFLKEVDSTSLQQVLKHLNKAYTNHFRRPDHFDEPQFKSKKKSKKSYTSALTNNNIRIEGKLIKLPKLGYVRIKMHRQLPKDSKITSVTVSKSASGKYYVSLTSTYEIEDINRKLDKKKSIGLDYAMEGLYVDSNGNSAEYNRYYRRSLTKLQKEQRKLSKCVLYSNNYFKQKRRISKIHEKIANQRKDFLHKYSTQIANEVDIVSIEDLNMKAMAKCLNFGKSVHDNGWGMFTTFLQYKLSERRKKLVKVDKWFASSKTCHECGNKFDKLTLKDRQWSCPHCGAEHQRDENAAINILKEGLRILEEDKKIVFA